MIFSVLRRESKPEAGVAIVLSLTDRDLAELASHKSCHIFRADLEQAGLPGVEGFTVTAHESHDDCIEHLHSISRDVKIVRGY